MRVVVIMLVCRSVRKLKVITVYFFSSYMMTLLLLLVTITISATASAPSTATLAARLPNTHLLNAVDLDAARTLLHSSKSSAVPPTVLTKSYNELKAALPSIVADKAEHSVMNKTLSLAGLGISKHNYLSIGIYDHPCNAQPKGCKPYPCPKCKPLPPSDCDNATGLPWVPCDGITNPEAIAEGDSPSQTAMANAVVMLGLGAFYSDNAADTQAYVTKAKDVVNTWFLANATAMLPNLYYGQITPHDGKQIQGHGGFIEWAHTAFLLDHLELLRFAAARDQLETIWTPGFDQALRAWWVAFESYVEGKVAQGERDMSNNHGTWYDTTWFSIALFNGNKSAQAIAAAEVNTRRVATQILPNGEEWIELKRNVPSGYCQYNLLALSQAADLAQSVGEQAGSIWEFATTDGRSLRKSIDWLTPYATNASVWPYKQPKAPEWKTMWQVLRRASIAYDSKKYEEAACTVMAVEQDSAYTKDILNLQLPPKFIVEC